MAAFDGPVQVRTAKTFFMYDCDKVISPNTFVKNVVTSSGIKVGRSVVLHRSAIMTYRYSLNVLDFSACGYSTPTTFRRLNYLLYYAYQNNILPFSIDIVGLSNPKIYIDGKEYPFYDDATYCINNVKSLSTTNPLAELNDKNLGVFAVSKQQQEQLERAANNPITFTDIVESL